MREGREARWGEREEEAGVRGRGEEYKMGSWARIYEGKGYASGKLNKARRFTMKAMAIIEYHVTALESVRSNTKTIVCCEVELQERE